MGIKDGKAEQVEDDNYEQPETSQTERTDGSRTVDFVCLHLLKGIHRKRNLVSEK